jgi:hypothetical protein
MAKQTFSTGQVLTAAQMTSLQQTAMNGGAASAKTASYVLVAADAGSAISMSSASATTITVNTGLFAAGDTVHITNLGAGVSTITAGTATVNSSATLTLAQYESGYLDFTSTSAAIFIKGAGAAAGGSGMSLIASGTLSGTSFTWSSLSTYSELVLFIYGATFTLSDKTLGLRINNNSGGNYFFNGVTTPNGVPEAIIDLVGTSFYNGRPVARTGGSNTFAVKFTNTKSTGFTDVNYTSFFVADNTQPYQTEYKGVYQVAETVSSLVLMQYATGSFNGGSYALWGA